MARAPAVAACLAVAAAFAAQVPPVGSAKRLEVLQRDIKRLAEERDALRGRESGLLDELARLDADLRLKEAQSEETGARLAAARRDLAARERERASLEADRAAHAPVVAARVREIYKEGALGRLAWVLAPASRASMLDGLRYATYLARRDSRQFGKWRESARRLDEERSALAAETTRLAGLEAEVGRSHAALASARAARAGRLSRVLADREQHDRAIAELESAARELERLVDTLGPSASLPPLDVRTFRGLLSWPADGLVSQRFGPTIHPRFKTVVPHPGLDIDAEQGAPFRSVFDGRVAYAAPLHGYGLTVIVDHGHGLVSIYAHAGALLVTAGDIVSGGAELGRVGDSGSLRGPYLYFELREAGKAVDPALWLRRR
jgi:murein hydrolase activator